MHELNNEIWRRCGMFINRLVFSVFTRICSALVSSALLAQVSVPAGNGSSLPAAPGSRLEVEQIEIGRNTAYPNAIHRHTGKFVLVLSDAHAPGLSFVIVSGASSAEGETPAPLLTVDRRYRVVAHRRAVIVDLPAGKYQLKSSPAGQVYCTLTID